MFTLSSDFAVSYPMLVLVSFLVGLGSFVDASAGGGGLITVPAYLLTGMPAHFAYGTNKVSAACGTFLAAVKFWRSGAMNIFAAFWAMLGSLTGSYLLARAALMLSDMTLRTLQLVVIPFVAVVILARKNFSDEDRSGIFSGRKLGLMSFVIGFCIGGYDAIIGPGTGTFAIIAFALVTKFDLKTAAGNAKVLNCASGAASLAAFAMAGTVYWKLAIPTTICSLLGNQLGARLALKNGAKYIRPMLICVLSLLLIKLACDVIGRI